MLQRFWNVVREVEWYAVFSILLLVFAVLLALLIATSVIEPMLWVLVVTLGFAAVVSAVLSHRT